MSSGRSGSTSKNGRPSIEKRILRMKERNQQMEHRISELETIVESQNVEIGHLSHALDMQAEQYGVQGNLLYDLSKNQRENAMLRDELAQRDNVIENMGQDIGILNQSVNELTNLRHTLETELHQKTEECLVLREEHDAATGESEDMKSEREELLNVVEERTKELEELRTKFETIASEKLDLEKESGRQAEETTARIQQLENELRTVQQRCEDLHTVTDYAENQLQAATDKCRSLEQQLQQSTQSKNVMEQEVSKLQSQLDFFVQQNLSNEKTRGESNKRIETLQQEVESLKKQIEEGQQMMETVSTERSKMETELREKISENLQELNNVYEKRDTLQTKCNEWQDAVQSLEQTVQELEEKVEEANQRVRRSDQSKSMVQKTLLGQISSLRDKVALQEEENEKQKEKILLLERESNRLKMLVEATKKARDSLSHSQQSRLQLIPQLDEHSWKKQTDLDSASEFGNSSTVSGSRDTSSEFDQDASSSWNGPTLREQLASLSAMSPSLLAHTGSLSKTILPGQHTVLNEYERQSDLTNDNIFLERGDLESTSSSDRSLYDSHNVNCRDDDGDDDDNKNDNTFHARRIDENESQGESNDFDEEEKGSERHNNGLIQRSTPTSPFSHFSSNMDLPSHHREDTSDIHNSFNHNAAHHYNTRGVSRLSTTSSIDYRRSVPRPLNPEPFQRSGVDDMKFSSRSESCNSSMHSSNSSSDISKDRHTKVDTTTATTTTAAASTTKNSREAAAAAAIMRIDNNNMTTKHTKQRFTREDGQPLTLFELAGVSESSILNE